MRTLVYREKKSANADGIIERERARASERERERERGRERGRERDTERERHTIL